MTSLDFVTLPNIIVLYAIRTSAYWRVHGVHGYKTLIPHRDRLWQLGHRQISNPSSGSTMATGPSSIFTLMSIPTPGIHYPCMRTNSVLATGIDLLGLDDDLSMLCMLFSSFSANQFVSICIVRWTTLVYRSLIALFL